MEDNEPSDPIRNKDGSISKMRAHRGNLPTLPQTKICPHCTARFTRSTHLTRHLKTHTNERLHKCPTCDARFTRSDLLQRHRKICQDPIRPNRPRSCLSCTESKVKCDRNDPCQACRDKGRECKFPASKRKTIDASPGSVQSSLDSTSSSSASPSPVPVLAAPFYPLDTLSAELADLTAPSASEALIHSHLSSIYENDAFQPFFSDVFSPNSSYILDEPALPIPFMKEIPLPVGLSQPWFQELLIYPSQPNYEKTEQRSLLNDWFTRESEAEDPQHYMYLFFNPFLSQLPLVHAPTFDLTGKPPYMLKSMKACGALFVKTKKANSYITTALAAVREGLAQAFDQTLTERADQVHLIIAVVLLETIGLFHQDPDERDSTNLYHELVVSMIRRTGLIAYNAAWTSVPSSAEAMWRDWVSYETTKRAIALSYLHECCRGMFFGLPPSYHAGEMNLRLPCEDALWRAQSAEEWLAILQIPVANHSSRSRLAGHDYPTTLHSMVVIDPNFAPASNLSPFAHFILIHVILRDLFTACTESTPLIPGERFEEDDNRALMECKYALHHWLYSWRTNQPPAQNPMEEPAFVENALPLYWLGHVAILAHQEGLGPFHSAANVRGEMRYKIVKRWLKHIRSFLTEGGGESTLAWDDLMKIQLQTWQFEYDTDGGADDQEGLLALFPDI
ncbi:hypothetical protein FB45DRAFT_893814 [Roridomyces roridus]|uniref:Zn(2)-C6 fungal-type domain-containing protein n=1 Tax=Roridomyces roridus TaxID=1738132 RepID=A0AAD7FZF3_9AGAR|nr:hypothetical protein FB45DRAFT_893814 [Roridomyces roridus]